MNSYDEAKVLKDIISSVADSSVKKGKIPTIRIGTVTTYNPLTNYAAVYLVGDESSNISNFLNKSNQALSAGDVVYILVLDNSLSNSFIAWKKGSYTSGDAGWIAPTLLNSWVNYGGGYSPTGYRMDSDGYVHLRGLVKSGTVNSVVFNLPIGYRPEYQSIHCILAGSNTSAYRLDVYANGDVKQVSGTNTWLSLEGITFKAL